MFSWLTNRRRRKLTAAPFPAEWETIVRQNVAHYCMLDHTEQARLQSLIQVFIAEKFWEGAGGLVLNDEIRVTISAQACLLLLGLEHNYYRNVRTIIVYPSTVIPPQRKPRPFEIVRSPLEPSQPLHGQAFLHGPVIIVWDAALQGSRHPDLGHNVIFHEFAHKLDMLDGAADGTPPLRNRDEYQEWVTICAAEFLRLKKDAGNGRRTFLNTYGAVNEAEFFAVATEQFFDQPEETIRHVPELYRVLKAYYRQDPVSRVRRNTCLAEG